MTDPEVPRRELGEGQAPCRPAEASGRLGVSKGRACPPPPPPPPYLHFLNHLCHLHLSLPFD